MEYNLENKSHLDTLRQALRTLRLSLLRPLLVQGAECFFESLDLLLALCNALFVGHASVDTCWLQFNDLLDGLIQKALFLCQAGVVFVNGGLDFGELSFLGALGDFFRAKRNLGGSLKLHELLGSSFF